MQSNLYQICFDYYLILLWFYININNRSSFLLEYLPFLIFQKPLINRLKFQAQVLHFNWLYLVVEKRLLCCGFGHVFDVVPNWDFGWVAIWRWKSGFGLEMGLDDDWVILFVHFISHYTLLMPVGATLVKVQGVVFFCQFRTDHEVLLRHLQAWNR